MRDLLIRTLLVSAALVAAPAAFAQKVPVKGNDRALLDDTVRPCSTGGGNAALLDNTVKPAGNAELLDNTVRDRKPKTGGQGDAMLLDDTVRPKDRASIQDSSRCRPATPPKP